MAITMSQISLPVFIRHLNGLAGCMKKAQTLYAEKKYDEASLLSYRFYPDMFRFAQQVQIASDHAKNCIGLLAGMQAPKYEDTEKSLAELITRAEQTVSWLKTIQPQQIDGSEDKSVTV